MTIMIIRIIIRIIRNNNNNKINNSKSITARTTLVKPLTIIMITIINNTGSYTGQTSW